MALRNGQGEVDYRFNILNICEMFGWTYKEYLSNPVWFLQLLDAKLEADNEHRKIEENKANTNGS